MSLLTRDERRALSRDERRAMRRHRRRLRSDAREDGDEAVVNFEALRRRAEDVLADYLVESIPWERRVDEALDEIADDIDDYVVWTWAGPAWPILEAVDGPAVRALVRALVRPVVEEVAERLRAEEVSGE